MASEKHWFTNLFKYRTVKVPLLIMLFLLTIYCGYLVVQALRGRPTKVLGSEVNQPFEGKEKDTSSIRIEKNENSGSNYGNIGGQNNTVNNIDLSIKQRHATESLLDKIAAKVPSKETEIIFIVPTNNSEAEIYSKEIISGLKKRGYTNIPKNQWISGNSGAYDTVSAYLEEKGNVTVIVHPARNTKK